MNPQPQREGELRQLLLEEVRFALCLCLQESAWAGGGFLTNPQRHRVKSVSGKNLRHTSKNDRFLFSTPQTETHAGKSCRNQSDFFLFNYLLRSKIKKKKHFADTL